ncbi:MAG: type II toxin-antitoxin system prevent-host-death family antitoxin [Acidobacteriota bacterium]
MPGVSGGLDSGLAALLIATEPLWIVVLFWLRPKGARPTLQVVAGLALGLAGMAFLVRPGGGTAPVGALAVLFTSFCWRAGRAELVFEFGKLVALRYSNHEASWMTRTIITPTDLSQRTREILDRVQQGEFAVVTSGGAERIVLLDALDFRLLLALALCATGEGDGDIPEARILRDYLDEKISLGKAAELLELTRFELESSFHRLGIPLRRGLRSVEDAQADIAVARRHA